MNQEKWKQFYQYGKIRHLKKNEYLLKPGQVCQHGYFLNKGSLVKTFLNKNRKETIQGFYVDEVYNYLSEVNSYFSGKKTVFHIKAIENCEIIEFPKWQLEYLMDNFQEFALLFYSIIEQNFYNLYIFSAMRLSLNPEDFFLFLYHQHPVYLRRIPDKYIAEFMGISKEWLSKLKKKVLKNNSQNR